MKHTHIADAYQTYFVDLRLERAGLFKALSRRYELRTVLYPGSWIHVTPSFYFPHVVYVDRSDDSQRCFASEADVLALIDAHKVYPGRSFVRFIAQDFTRPLPLKDGDYDLLLALGAGGIAASCKRYLRVGGLLVSSSFQDEALIAAQDPEYRLVGVMQQSGETWTIREEGLEAWLEPRRDTGPEKRHLKQMGGGAFRKTADAYVFEKVRGA